MDERAIARWRLHTMRLSGRSYPSPTAVVDGLLGVEAENPAQASWADWDMTVADARAGLAAVADHVESFGHDGRTYWFADDPPTDDRVEPRAH